MKCEECREEVAGLKWNLGDPMGRCRHCHVSSFIPSTDIHKSGNNKHAPKMTMVMRKRLESRKIGPDGRVHVAPRWRKRGET